MSTQIVTLDPSHVVSIELSEEIASAMGLKTGSHLAVKLEDRRIVLEPLLAESLDDLYGIFSDAPGLVEGLQRDRRQDKW